MVDRSNVGERLLGTRKTVQGTQDALANIIGGGLNDGATCYVIQEQANYRFVASSQLAPDGKLVVATVGNRGRWIREAGLVGLALLDSGLLPPESSDFPGLTRCFADYKQKTLAQFELQEGAALYVGTVPRLALVFGSADLAFERGGADLYVRVDNEVKIVTSSPAEVAGFVACSGSVLLMPGDRLSLCVRLTGPASGSGSLRVVLA